MKLFTVFLAGCLISAPLCALEQKGRVITLTKAEYAECKTDGCALINLDLFKKELARARAAGRAEAKAEAKDCEAKS